MNSDLSNRPLQHRFQIPFHFTMLQSRCISPKPITAQDFIVLTLGIYCAFLHGLIYEARSRYSNIDLFKSDFIFLFSRCGQPSVGLLNLSSISLVPKQFSHGLLTNTPDNLFCCHLLYSQRDRKSFQSFLFNFVKSCCLKQQC